MSKLIVAVEDAGFRAIAGPITAASVVFYEGSTPPAITYRDGRGSLRTSYPGDGKKIAEAPLQTLVAHIKRSALSWAYVASDAEKIRSTRPKDVRLSTMELAVARALEKVRHLSEHAEDLYTKNLIIYVAGPERLTSFECDQILFPKVSDVDWRVIAAGMIAKVARDAKMATLADRYPEYRFDSHMGYPTVAHKRILKKNGPTPEHRNDE